TSKCGLMRAQLPFRSRVSRQFNPREQCPLSGDPVLQGVTFARSAPITCSTGIRERKASLARFSKTASASLRKVSTQNALSSDGADTHCGTTTDLRVLGVANAAPVYFQ